MTLFAYVYTGWYGYISVDYLAKITQDKTVKKYSSFPCYASRIHCHLNPPV